MQSDTKHHTDLSANTIVAHGRKMEANSLLNIPNVARAHGIKKLRDQFKGCRAVVAGAGPSLDTAIPALKAHAGEYLLIAADRALKPLLDAGLVPHIVCTADMDEVLQTLFTGYDIPPSVALLFDKDCYHGVPLGWNGPLITYDHYYDSGIWQTTFVGHKGFLCKNFTVSHTALYVAATMGCSAVLVGVDFAYPSAEQHHAAGAVGVANEAKEKALAHWTDIPGNVLETVHTTEVFSACIPTMENAITEVQVDVVNTSAIGAKIKNAPYVAIEEAMGRPSERQDFTARMASLVAGEPEGIDMAAFDIQSRHVILAMDQMLQDATEGIEHMWKLKRVDGLRNKLLFPKWQRMFLKMQALREKMFSDHFTQYLLQRTMLACVTKMKAMLQPVAHLKDHHPMRLVTDCSRHTLLFWQLGECAKLFIQCLQDVRKRYELEWVPIKWQIPTEQAAGLK